MTNYTNAMRILIVEDTPSLLQLYSHLLVQAGYLVLHADSGTKAQQLIRDQAPDIVLIDRVLPDLDGSEICHWIKGDPAFAQTYVIMMSALRTSDDDRLSGLEAGADDYLVKPVNKRELLARIKVAKRLKAAQWAVQASEAKHRTLTENSPDLIIRFDAAGVPIYANSRIHHLLHVSPDEFVARGWSALHLPQDVICRWRHACTNVVATGVEQRIDITHAAGDEFRFMDARLVPEFDVDGTVGSILAVLRDFTEHLRAEQIITRLAAVVQQTQDPVVMTDRYGRIQYSNRAFHALTGHNEHSVGQPIQKILGATDEAPSILDHFVFVQNSHMPWEGVSFIRRTDGRRCEIEASLFPITDIQGNVTSLVAILRDLTERRRSEREREVLLAIAGALRKATTREEVIQVVLERIMAMLNVEGAALATIDPETRETVIEMAVGEHSYMIGARYTEPTDVMEQILDTGKPYLLNELHLPQVPATIREAEIVNAFLGVPMIVEQRGIGVIWIGSAYAIAHTASDILLAIAEMAANSLHRVSLYQELQDYAADLEQRVAERTWELAEANQGLLELDRLKSKFVSNVSHELRTPISNLKLYMSLLKRGKPDKRAHYEAMLETSVERLGQLVEDILNLSRLEIAQYQPREFAPTDFNAIVSQTVNLHQPQAESNGVKLLLSVEDTLPLINGDYNQLSQLVSNLVVNALNYTPRGSVEVTTFLPNGGSSICLKVKDTGIGIMPEDQPHIFERFYRGNHRQPNDIPGTGLGLAIVREIVDIHQGTINLESHPDIGTQISVVLPVQSYPGVGD